MLLSSVFMVHVLGDGKEEEGKRKEEEEKRVGEGKRITGRGYVSIHTCITIITV